MNQDTHLYIEANQKHGHGYQVHIVIDGIVDTTMADEPFSLYDALGGTQLTLEAVNKERGTNYLLPDVLLVSREAAEAERRTDFLKTSGRKAALRPVKRFASPMPLRGKITSRKETMSAWPSAGTLRSSAMEAVRRNSIRTSCVSRRPRWAMHGSGKRFRPLTLAQKQSSNGFLRNKAKLKIYRKRSKQNG